MVCPQCGAEVVADAIFCHKCGHQLGEQDSQTDPVSQDYSCPGIQSCREIQGGRRPTRYY